MNSIWNKNIGLFRKRFPALASMLEEQVQAFEKKLEGNASLPLQVIQAKDGNPTASENGAMLHSKYNPLREATLQISSFNAEEESSALFFSCGLGYAPITFCKTHPSVPAIIIEENAEYLMQAMSVLDWESVLTHAAISLLVGADLDSVASVLHQYDMKKAHVFSVPAQMSHSADYFKNIHLVIEQDKSKDETNTATLEKFARLWLSNTCRNIRKLDELDGILKYSGLGKDIPFVVIAAGPSLSRVLPNLAKIKEKAMLVCVDSALRSCLDAGVEPDFIVLVDPQYACAMHLEFLSAPSSVLITEVAAWPSVFRFDCKEKVLCSSMYPPGQYFESRMEQKGKLGAGGSVATTAWDFARFCGAGEIFIVGMDLGYPGRQTHIRGSQFEEREHRLSSRLFTSEYQSVSALLSANPVILKDYRGADILSDKKMSLFSWWFEKNCASAMEQGVKSYSLTEESLAIKGIQSFPLEEFLERPSKLSEKESFFGMAAVRGCQSKGLAASGGRSSFNELIKGFIKSIEELLEMAAKGISLCDKAISNRLKAPEVFAQLDKIDSFIMKSETKEAASLVFPTERRLKELSSDLPDDKTLRSLYYSRIIYRELKKACQDYLEFFSSF